MENSPHHAVLSMHGGDVLFFVRNIHLIFKSYRCNIYVQIKNVRNDFFGFKSYKRKNNAKEVCGNAKKKERTRKKR